MAYITLQEAKDFMWITWTDDDTLITNMINKSELKINSVLWVETLDEVTEDESYAFSWSSVYILNCINPTSLNNIDWNAVLGATRFDWRKLRFEYAPTLTDIIFNKIVFNITKWFATIPEDVKFACLSITKIFYTDAKSWTITSWGATLSWVKNFKQWDLSVTYTSDSTTWENGQSVSTEKEAEDLVKTSLKKYLKNNIYSV